MNRGVSVRCAQMQPLQRGFCTLTALALASMFAAPAHAERVNATGTSQATVVAPLSLIKIRDLNFGRIAARTTAGTVTVDPDTGACTVTGPILSVGGCGFSEFAGMGSRRMNVRIQIPTTVTLTGQVVGMMFVY